MGVTANGTFFSKTEPMRVARSIAEHSNQLILVADSSKMNRHAFLYGLDVRQFNTLVTDDSSPASLLEKLEESIERSCAGTFAE
jgi:DeoR/GlpR family transcriptional regulator of sugar metabolism